MSNKLLWKSAITLIVLLGSIWLLYPSIQWYSEPAEEQAKLEQKGLRPKRILNLGLDLKGGTSLLLELDITKLKNNEKPTEALARAIEILRNRIDQYGVGETQINRQGERWISVQLPGIENPDEAERLIGKTALLEFKLVNTGADAQKAISIAYDADKPFKDNGDPNDEIAKALPKDAMLLKSKEGEFMVVSASATLTGAYLENARVETGGNFGRPNVAFEFNPEGGRIFARLTGENVNKQLAIVLDGVVHSAPNIKSRISGGRGIIEGNFTIEEAKNLAIVLKAGALPAPVSIIEKRTVGPGLGEDSIKAGVKASLLGLGVILLFMMVYYKASGLIADVALVLNFVILLGAMSYFGATLTLPGIAGMILSLAMAVDANVLILERIREEKLNGKPLSMAINLGYEKAWSAILDSNLTTWIAAIFLFQFGSGPVKGFAVTLILGLVIGVFTSVFVTRTMYEFWLTSNPEDISI